MRRALLVLAALVIPALAAAEIAVPPLKARVTDQTGTLTAPQQQALEQMLAEFEARKGSQVAVLLVPSTQPETVEQFAVRVQESWKLGRKGVDDGVLLLVAKDDRKLRIEVGYGLEGVLPDAAAKRIIEEDIVPRFKQGDFYGGVRAGTDRILRVIEGEQLLPRPTSDAGGSLLSQYSDLLIPGVILVIIAGSILNALFGRFIGAGLIGTVAGFAVWVFVGSLLVALIVGLVVFVLSMFSGTSGLGRTGGWTSSSGGGWSSGGGFSGGGGSSGGGGASGSW
ncbi:MAG: YgcG family protein [Betaproteobacteria bacterium]|nr:YgcG family protein [Betaproteobacteria bacterium]